MNDTAKSFETRYADDPIFGPLAHRFHEALAIYPDLRWEASGTHEKDHKVFAIYGKRTRAIGFAHELATLSTEQFQSLLALYFPAQLDALALLTTVVDRAQVIRLLQMQALAFAPFTPSAGEKGDVAWNELCEAKNKLWDLLQEREP